MPDRLAITQSWQAIIADLERDVERLQSGQLLPGDEIPSARWSPPTMIGPLPDEYAHHVRSLIHAQREAMAALEEARRRTAEQLAAVNAVAATGAAAPAVYLDVEG